MTFAAPVDAFARRLSFGDVHIWLDFSPLGIGDPANYFFKKANVALTDGRECGEVGRGCVRMNFAMPYPLLEECFDRMAVALEADGLL